MDINYTDTINYISKDKLEKYTREELTSYGYVNVDFTTNQSLTSTVLSAGNRFPNDLSSEKSVAIHIYNTSKQDKVFNGLIDSTANLGTEIADLFVSDKDSDITSAIGDFTSSLGDVYDSVKENFKKISVEDTTDRNFKHMDINKDMSYNFGNQKLAKDYYESFYLPIPNNLQESISNNYEEQPGWVNDTIIGAGAKGAINAVMHYDAKTANLATLAKMTGARNVQYYENKLQMYSSTDFREITLNWELVPNNEKESRLLHEIVRKIKMYGSPETASGNLILKSPCYFGIEFKNKTLDKALQFYEVVLTNVSIDYVPGGNMEMNEDQTPKFISLSMTFKDREPKLRQDWETINTSSGTGSNDQSCPS